MIHVINCHPKPINNLTNISNDLSLFLHLFSHILYKDLDLRDPYRDMAPLSNQRCSSTPGSTLAPRSVFGCFPQPEEACIRNTAGIGGLAKHRGDLVVLRGIIIMGRYGIQPIIFVGTQPWIWGYNDIYNGISIMTFTAPPEKIMQRNGIYHSFGIEFTSLYFLGCYTNDWIILVKLNDWIFWSSFSCTMLPVGRVD